MKPNLQSTLKLKILYEDDIHTKCKAVLNAIPYIIPSIYSWQDWSVF